MFAKQNTQDMSDERSIGSVQDSSDPSMKDSARDVAAQGDGKPEILQEQDGYQTVQCTKWLVYVVLFVCAAASATATFFFVRSDEKTEFEDEVSSLRYQGYSVYDSHRSFCASSQYHTFARGIVSSAEQSIEGVYGQLHSMATTTTSLAKSTNQLWPFVVVPDFEQRAEAVSSLSSANMIMLTPIVQSIERAQWNSFSSKNRNWTASVSRYMYSKDLLRMVEPPNLT